MSTRQPRGNTDEIKPTQWAPHRLRAGSRRRNIPHSPGSGWNASGESTTHPHNAYPADATERRGSLGFMSRRGKTSLLLPRDPTPLPLIIRTEWPRSQPNPRVTSAQNSVVRGTGQFRRMIKGKHADITRKIPAHPIGSSEPQDTHRPAPSAPRYAKTSTRSPAAAGLSKASPSCRDISMRARLAWLAASATTWVPLSAEVSFAPEYWHDLTRKLPKKSRHRDVWKIHAAYRE